MILWFALGSGREAAPPPLPTPPHAGGWESLVAAAERGDLSTVRVLARDLSLGPIPDDDPAAEELGAALGFLQLIDDPEDLGPAISRAGAACVRCHQAHGVY